MDQYGARVTSVAMEIGADSAGTAPPLPKNLLLNKPYWVIMKRKDSPRPYFILGVRNTAMMKKEKAFANGIIQANPKPIADGIYGFHFFGAKWSISAMTMPKMPPIRRAYRAVSGM